MTLRIRIDHRFAGITLSAAFTAQRPGVTALFGPSGAGKSSLIKAVAGLWRPTDAEITWDGDALTDTRARVFVPPHKRRFAAVFQEARLFPHMRVDANLRFGWRRAGRAMPEEEISRLIGLLGIADLLGRRPLTLSGGERQRVAIGRALMAGPRMLLLDEPVSALDGARRNEIVTLLERLRDEAGVPMLYVSHAVEEVARLADTIVLLDAGKIVAQGATADILSRLDLLPLTGMDAAGAIVRARIDDNDPAAGLTRLVFDAGALTVPLIERPVGTLIRLRVPARDVLIAVEEPRGLSANTICPAVIAEIAPHGQTEADIKLLAGSTALLARITKGSVARLALKPGKPVFAIVKSVTLARP